MFSSFSSSKKFRLPVAQRSSANFTILPSLFPFVFPFSSVQFNHSRWNWDCDPLRVTFLLWCKIRRGNLKEKLRTKRERKSESPLWTMPNISMLWPEVWKKKCGGMRGEAVRRCYGSHGFKVAGITTRTWPFRQSRLATAARSFEKRIRPRVIRFCYARVPIYRGPHAPETDPPIHLPNPRVPRIFASTNPFDSPSPLASIDL